MNDCALIVMMKNPILGMVKTRLAEGIGENKALEVYEYLIKHTKTNLRGLAFPVHVYYSHFVDEKDSWPCSSLNKQLQEGNDLGQRMRNAAKEVLQSGTKRVVIIGTDCLDISKNIIMKAFKHLEEKEVVIGPAEDGGYYLIGFVAAAIDVLSIEQWGTNKVLELTMERAAYNAFNYVLLNCLTDIDTREDLDKYIRGNSELDNIMQLPNGISQH